MSIVPGHHSSNKTLFSDPYNSFGDTNFGSSSQGVNRHGIKIMCLILSSIPLAFGFWFVKLARKV